MAITAASLMVEVGADTSSAEQDIQGFRSRLNQTAADLGRTGAYMTAAVSAPIIAIGADALRTAANFQQGMAQVGALSGATASELDALTSTAEQLGRTTSFSASEAAEGMSFLAMAGFEVNDTIDAMPGLLAAAAAGQTDLATTADIVSNVLSGMGWEAERTGELADIMTATFTRSNTSLEQLGSAMSYVAPQSANLGISMEETAAAVGLLSDAGIQGTRAGTGLNAVLSRLGAPTEAAADAMAELGVNVFDAEGNMRDLPGVLNQFERALDGMTQQQRTEALSQIFDTRALTSFNVLLSAGSENLDEFASTMDSVKAADVAADQLDTFEGQVKLLNSALEGLKITVVRSVLPALQDLISRAGPMITRVTEWFEALDRNAQLAGFAFLGIAAAAGPVMLALAGVAAAVSFLLTPIGAVVAASAVLGAAWVGDFAGMRTATMGFVDTIRGLVTSFQNARDMGLEPLRAAVFTVQNALENMGLQWASDALGDFETAAAEAWRQGVELVSNLENWPAPLQALATAVMGGATQLGMLFNHIRNVIDNSDSFRDAMVTLGRQGVDFLRARIVALLSNLRERLQPLEDAFERISEIMAGIAAGDLQPARDALNDAFDAITSFDFAALASTLGTAGTDVANAILNSFKQIDLPALRDDIISKLGLDNFQLFASDEDVGLGNLPGQMQQLGIAFGAIREGAGDLNGVLPGMNEHMSTGAIAVAAMREAAERLSNLDWATIQLGGQLLVTEVQNQLTNIDWSGAANGLRLRIQSAFRGIDWQRLSPINLDPLINNIQRNFGQAQQQLNVFLAGDNPLTRFFERARGVVDTVSELMSGIGGVAPAQRFERVVSAVLATVQLVGETRFDLIQTAARHISTLVTSILNFGTDIVDSLDSERIAEVLGGVAKEWSSAFAAVFEGTDLFDMAAAAGKLGSSFVNKLSEILGAPEFGEDIGGAIAGATIALTTGAVELAKGIVSGLSDIDFSQFSANFNSFAQGFVTGVNEALSEADFTVSSGGRDAMTLAIQDSIIDFFGQRIPSLEWEDHIDSPTWADFITALNWTEVGVIAIDWATYLTPLTWDNVITAIAWTSYIKTFSWSEFIDDIDWVAIGGGGINWAVYISPLQWNTIIDAIAWSEWLSSLDWSNYVTSITSWDTWVKALQWATYVTSVDWTTVISALRWAQFVKSFEWSEFITNITSWNTWIKNLSWSDFITALTDWDEWVSALGWTDHITALTDWNTWISSLGWADHITALTTWHTWISSLSWFDHITGLTSWSTWIPTINWRTFIPNNLSWPSVGQILSTIASIVAAALPGNLGGDGGRPGGPSGGDSGESGGGFRSHLVPVPSRSADPVARSAGNVHLEFSGPVTIANDMDLEQVANEIVRKIQRQRRV